MAKEIEFILTKNEQIMEDLNLPKAQRRIVPLLMMGLSNEDIADHLYLTAKGVKYQITNLYKATGLESRTRLMAGMVKLGWQMDARVMEPKRVPKLKPNQVPQLSLGVANVKLRA